MPVVQDPVSGLMIDSDTGQPVDDANIVVDGQGTYQVREAPAYTGVNPYDKIVKEQQETAQLGPLSSPSQLPPSAPGAVAPQGQVRPGLKSVSASSRQYDPAVAQQVEQERQRTVVPQENKAEDYATAGLNRDTQRLNAATGDQKQAMEDSAAALAASLESKSVLLEAHGRLEGRLIAADRAAQEISQAEVQAARGRFEQGIAAVRAASVDPTLNFTPVELVGVAGAVFAQFFLGAQGVKAPDVVGMLDKWTDRYVDNQMEKIKRGERLLDSDRAVWDMVRAEADDEQDARARLNILTLSQAETEMEVQAARWGAQMAMAQGAEAVAGLRALRAEKMAKLEMDWGDKAITMKRDANTASHQRSMASIASKGLELDREKFEAQQKAAGPTPFILQSWPDAQGRTTPIATPKQGVPPELIKESLANNTKARAAVVSLDKLIGHVASKGKPFSDNSVLQRLGSSDDAVLAAARSEYVIELKNLAAMGANFTGMEKGLIDDTIMPADYFTRRDTKDMLRVLNSSGLYIINKADEGLRDYFTDNPNNPMAGLDPSWSVAGDKKKMYQLGVDPQDPVKSSAEKAEERFTGTQKASGLGVTPFAKAVGAEVANSGIQHDWGRELETIAFTYVNGNPDEKGSAIRILDKMKDWAVVNDATGRAKAAVKLRTMIANDDPALKLAYPPEKESQGDQPGSGWNSP